jgi:hypothetical protein
MVVLATSPDEGTPDVLAQVTERADGRRVINRLYIAGPELDLKALRSIPLDQLETRINQRADWPKEVAPGPDEGGSSHPLTVAGDGYLTAQSDQLAELVTDERGDRPPLRRPDGTDPEGFYALVAVAYREALAAPAPAKALADEAGVPVPTVHRWVREARRRGLLAPAKKRGRAG